MIQSKPPIAAGMDVAFVTAERPEGPMRHSLHSHIIYLENRIQSLKDGLTRPRLTTEEIQSLELQISVAELALTRYREAYSLELSVSNPDPSTSPETKPDFDNGAPDNPKRRKREGGLAIALRRRKKVQGAAVALRMAFR